MQLDFACARAQRYILLTRRSPCDRASGQLFCRVVFPIEFCLVEFSRRHSQQTRRSDVVTSITMWMTSVHRLQLCVSLNDELLSLAQLRTHRVGTRLGSNAE
ncbi:hypothetical protein K788_0000042 [Paraburkholderia caribensis MBA4]|uniref:Uncharacterized protein n=1 Tax=Paraburkholderia caribensis MBA4 TaxID=1323664 RepID=A0A0P0RJJ4_9BURK|nr:hypothetical protein K788_0000042 [Paraburkholderia caribensis MBA4]